MSFNDFQNQQFDGGQYNAQTSQKKYTILNFDLSQATSLADAKWKMNFPIKSFWVRSASKDFVASIKLNPAVDEGDPLPLSRNMNLAYEFPQAGVAFEWPAQAGKTMQIVFAHDSSIDVGLVENEVSAEFSPKRFSNIVITNFNVEPSLVAQEPQLLLAPNPLRDHAFILHNQGFGQTPIGLFTREIIGGWPNYSPVAQLHWGWGFEWDYNFPLYVLKMGKSYGSPDYVSVHEVMK